MPLFVFKQIKVFLCCVKYYYQVNALINQLPYPEITDNAV